MNIYSASKSAGQDEKRSEQVRRLPVRMHELLGIPKSTGKKKKVDGTQIENPLPQPVRIKDLFGSTSCKKKTSTVAARRMTTLANTTSNAHRQLYNDDPRDRISSRSITTISTGSCTVNDIFPEINSNVRSQKRPEPVKLLGHSRSDGKIKRTCDLGCERLKTERVKDFMESWEKSQTVQPRARKFTAAPIHTTNARRKLYSVLPPSPSTTSKVSRKSSAPKKLQSDINVIPDKKIVQSQAARKSCLLPPNSIRNRYVSHRQNETIKEESLIDNSQSRKTDDTEIQNDEKKDSNDNNRLNTTATLESDYQDSRDGNESGNSDETVARYEISANNQINNLKNFKSIENLTNSIDVKESFEKSVKNIDKKMCISNDSTEIPRPSVIMGISAKGMRKESENSTSCSEKSFYEISRPPLRELSRHSVLLQPRLDENATSFEDLLGNSRHERGESFYRENLPPDSFLENAGKTKNSFVNMDMQTLSWMHGNLKLAVQSTEEHLFSMKLVLQAMEDVMKNYNNSETEKSRTKIENRNISPHTNSISNAVKNDDEESRIYKENNVDVQITNKDLNIPFVNEKLVVTDSGNENDSPILRNPDVEDKENVFTKNDEKIENNDKKPRRRSLRIAEKMGKSSKRLDDSFSRIEEELNIVHDKTKKETPRGGKSGKRLDPRSRRSIRKYMALKSTMNFLDTPDVKGLPTPKCEKDTPSHHRATRRSLSRKLLIELDDLYAESPL